MQICKFILGQVACMKRGPHDDSVIYKDLEQIFISDQGTRCLFLEKKRGGEGWRGGGGCYLVRALLFTERARARLVCDTVLLLQECCVCWLTMSILAFDRAGIKVHTLHQGDSIVTVLIHPSLSLSPIAGVRDDRIIARYLKSFKFSHVSEMTFSQGEILIFLFFFSQ